MTGDFAFRAASSTALAVDELLLCRQMGQFGLESVG